MDYATPQPGDLLLTRNGHGSIFISRVMADGTEDFYATSSALLEQRGVSRHSRHRTGTVDYQAAPDFTIGRVFDKGQARHLIRQYLPELLSEADCTCDPADGCGHQWHGPVGQEPDVTRCPACGGLAILETPPRILLRREFGWELDVTRPAMKPGKARRSCRARF
jgi:hypothetical protein